MNKTADAPAGDLTRELLDALKLAVREVRDMDHDEAMAGEFEILTDAIDRADEYLTPEPTWPRTEETTRKGKTMNEESVRVNTAIVATIRRLAEMGKTTLQIAAEFDGIRRTMQGEYCTAGMAVDAGIEHAERIASRQ